MPKKAINLWTKKILNMTSQIRGLQQLGDFKIIMRSKVLLTSNLEVTGSMAFKI
jgi:hypothetical protein